MTEQPIGHCWHCGRDLFARDFGRETTCLGCAKATRVCRNCRWFAPGRPNECLEPVAERVTDKERANFCDFFEPSLDAFSGDAKTGADALRTAAEDLFK